MISTEGFMLLTLVFMRMSGCVIFNPILGRRNIPAIAKAGFIIVLTVLVYPVVQTTVVMADTVTEYGVLLLKEFIIGYIIGFIINLFFYFIIFAGEIIDLQMGLSMSKIYDAQSNASLSLSATLYNALFILLFFTVDGHLTMINILISSGNVVPYGSIMIHSGVSTAVLDIFCQCTVLAVKFAFPVFAIEFLAEAGVGILMKTIPQINVFVVNIQAKVLIGFFVLLLFFSPMSQFLERMIVVLLETLKDTLIIMR